MTRKDFKSLVKSFSGMALQYDVLKALCSFCKSQNPRFNLSMFLNALEANNVQLPGRTDNLYEILNGVI